MPESNTAKRIAFFQMACKLGDYAWLKNIRIMPTALYRTAEEQKRLFDEGKSKCDGTKNVSKHQRWRAVDIVIVDADGECIWATPEYAVLGKFWESLGGTWGGSWAGFPDQYHFEY